MIIMSLFTTLALFFFFFFNDTATTEIYTLSLHDALPIYRCKATGERSQLAGDNRRSNVQRQCVFRGPFCYWPPRSEEHTSELQSPCNLVCRLLLEKKKKENKPPRRMYIQANHERH